MEPGDLLAYLVNHPDVLPWVAPGHAQLDTEHLDVPGVLLFGNVLGGVLFMPSDEPGVYEMHQLFTSELRGAALLYLVRQAFKAMFTDHGATVICGAVPRNHRAARVVAHALGGRPVSSHTDTFGRPCIIYALERKTWAISSAVS